MFTQVVRGIDKENRFRQVLVAQRSLSLRHDSLVGYHTTYVFLCHSYGTGIDILSVFNTTVSYSFNFDTYLLGNDSVVTIALTKRDIS